MPPRAKPWSKAKVARRDISPDERWAAEIGERLLADCHPVQALAAGATHRYQTWLVGRGGGKTTAHKVRYIRGMSAIAGGRFVYGAPTREMATDLLWEPMQETCARLGIETTFKEVQRVCIFRRTGARLKLVGLDDKREMGKLRGQPFDGVGVDEICEFPPDLIAWFVDRIVGPRLGERGGWIALSSTPGHILRGLFYDATRPGSPLHVPHDQLAQHPGWQGWVSYAWSLRQVAEQPGAAAKYPAIVANYLEQQRLAEVRGWGPDNPIRLRELEGRWAADDTQLVFRYRPHVDGQPWNQWDPPRRGPLAIAVLPDAFTDWMFVVTLDEGASDPFAINAFAFSPSDTSLTIYHVYAFERGRRRSAAEAKDATPEQAQRPLYARELAHMLIGEALDHDHPGGLIGELGDWPVGMEGDCGEATLGELANVYGIRIERFNHTMKYKTAAIAVVNGDLVDGRLKILKGSPLEQQLGELQWAEDSYGNLIENKAQANHSTDTLIIARRVIGKLITAGTVTLVAAAPAKARDTNPAARAPAPEPADEIPDRDEGFAVRGEFAGMLIGGDYDGGWGNDL